MLGENYELLACERYYAYEVTEFVNFVIKRVYVLLSVCLMFVIFADNDHDLEWIFVGNWGLDVL